MIKRFKAWVADKVGAVMANWALDAARVDEGWGWQVWPQERSMEIDEMDQVTIRNRARLLYNNCPQIRKAVLNMVHFTGGLTPLPCTADEEWNELALATFHARTKNPMLFDVAARVNYKQALAFMERSVIIDGDVALVPTFGADGGAQFAFYGASQIAGGGSQGVEIDALNRAVAYFFVNGGKVSKLPAWQVVLYRHQPDPSVLRGTSELVAALKNGKDIHEIVGLAKNGIKIASQMGLVMTKGADDKHGGIGSNVGGGRKNQVQTEDGPKSVLGTGLSITALPPGRELKTIQDNRPSTQLQDFFAFLVRCVALAVGLDPEVLFYTLDLGSASARFNLEKLERWAEERLVDLEVPCNRIWQHVISCEIAAGRLRACKDPAWQNVRWVAQRDMTIDKSRYATSEINLSRELLADADDWCLRTAGLTQRQLAAKAASNLAHIKKIAADNGLTLAELKQGMVGSTNVPTPQHVADDEPEVAPTNK